jgi:hypothetical protein
VDVFFVISGYLLTAGLLQRLEDQRRISLRRYYAVRMIRLLPAVAVVLPVTLTATWWLSPIMLRARTGHPDTTPYQPTPVDQRPFSECYVSVATPLMTQARPFWPNGSNSK